MIDLYTMYSDWAVMAYAEDRANFAWREYLGE